MFSYLFIKRSLSWYDVFSFLVREVLRVELCFRRIILVVVGMVGWREERLWMRRFFRGFRN